LRSGQTVAGALAALGYDYVSADPSAASFKELDMQAYDVVFLALHGKGYEDGTLQRQLEEQDIPFTGSGSAASELCFDKWKYKNFMKDKGIRVTEGQLVSLHRMDEHLFQTPYVLKPCDEGSSLDTHIVRVPSPATFETSKRLLESHSEMLLETLVEGTEITVGILGDEALPVIEIIPPEGREFDYANKYNGLSQELCPPEHVDSALQEEAKRLALRIHQLAGCRDMSRTDMMVDASGTLHVIETNTIPGLTAQSLLPKMVTTQGMSIPAFIDFLLKAALSRRA
jgi:D-alanine-D-alanine ligase